MTGDSLPLNNTSLTGRLDVNVALQAAGLGVWEVDPITNQVIWDDRCRALFGINQGNQLPYEQAISYIHPDDVMRVNQGVQQAMNTQSGGLYDETYRTIGMEDGRLRWVRFWGHSYFDDAGRLNRFSGLAQDVTRQLNAQLALVESESHLQLLRDTVPAMIVYLDSHQRYQSHNQVFKEWFGVEGDEAIGKTVNEFIGPEAYTKTQPHLAKAYQGQRVQHEMYAPSRMNADRWLSIVYTPHKNVEGIVIGVIVHATDISQSKLAELELRASEARFRAVFEEATVATCLFVGRELRIDIANGKMLEVWGKDQSVIGKPLAEAVPELKGQPFLAILDEVFTSGQAYSAKDARAELEVDGVLGTYYFDFTYKPLFNEAGEVYAIMDMAVDVTQQIIAQQNLKEAESGLRVAVELAQLGTWSIDVATNELTFSDRLIEWFGYDPAAKEYTQVIPILSPTDQQRVDQAVAWALNPDSDGVYNEIYTVIHPLTGMKRILHAQGKTVFDATGKAIRLNGTAQDITVQRELQLALELEVQRRIDELAATNEKLAASNKEYAAINAELDESNQLLSRSNENLQQFAYVASHDLQEPLRKIQQFGDLLKTGQADKTGESILYVERMQSAASRMSRLIKDLLDFSRISTQRDASDSVSLQGVVERVVSTLDLRVEELGAQIRVGSLPTVLGDSSQLGQLFQNLLSNALKFHRPGSSPLIEVTAQWLAAEHLPKGIKPGRGAIAYHRIDVVDNGIGFDEKYLDRIFQVFQRLHGKNEFAGTGIGLAICEKVVLNHGGAITAMSHPGQGATFSVYLPG